MPFIPHTEQEVREMLSAIGADSIESLFDEIPANLRAKSLDQVPPGLNEMQVSRLMTERAAQDRPPLCFIGAGAYEHHIPAAVWELTTRGEFYTAYTPYQAEASQGTLQLLYEFQSMICALTDMDVANASLYDGASALAEAVLMAIRANRQSKSKRILIPRSVHPAYRKVVNAIVGHQGVVVEELPLDVQGGYTDPAKLPSMPGEIAAVVIPQPNFLGVLEEVDVITNWAHAAGALVIACVNPMVMSVITPPGKWGEKGADIVCGEGQPLGIPLSSGGPYFGFMSCRQEHVRQMPGRIIGRTVDLDGKPGFALTLQAREQHIRRSKATSNICTNQGLMTTAATIYMALKGPQGLQQVAIDSHNNTHVLAERLKSVSGVKRLFNRPFFHELVLQLNKPASDVLARLANENIAGGFALEADYPELGNALLVCATETKMAADIERYADALSQALA